MDRDFKTPQDTANASSDRVAQSLGRVLRIGFESRQFVFRLKFPFEGGHIAPLLYIGNLNRSWSDYINANARANDMAVGTCELARGPTGRTLIKLNVERGRGKRDSALAELNRNLRRINAEVVYADSTEAGVADGGADAAAADASASAVADLPDGADVPDGAASAFDLGAEARALRADFQTFKAEPTQEGLEALEQRVAQCQSTLETLPGLQDSKEAKFVEQLRGLLETKGAAFVAKG